MKGGRGGLQFVLSGWVGGFWSVVGCLHLLCMFDVTASRLGVESLHWFHRFVFVRALWPEIRVLETWRCQLLAFICFRWSFFVKVRPGGNACPLDPSGQGKGFFVSMPSAEGAIRHNSPYQLCAPYFSFFQCPLV